MAFCGVDATLSGVVCVVVTMTLRYLSVIFDWRTSAPVDLTPRLSGSASQFFNQLFVRSGDRHAHEEAVVVEETRRLQRVAAEQQKGPDSIEPPNPSDNTILTDDEREALSRLK